MRLKHAFHLLLLAFKLGLLVIITFHPFGVDK